MQKNLLYPFSNCYFSSSYVVCDIRRDNNYYFCQESSTWLKNDYVNCTHYVDVESIPEFSINVTVFKIYTIMECVGKIKTGGCKNE